jgi:hypothetical protein
VKVKLGFLYSPIYKLNNPSVSINFHREEYKNTPFTFTFHSCAAHVSLVSSLSFEGIRP